MNPFFRLYAGAPTVGALLALLIHGALLSRTLAGEYLVADQAAARIVAFDSVTGAYTRTVASTGFFLPSAMTLGPGGSLYVTDLLANTVMKVDPAATNGTPVVFPLGPTVINAPGSIAYDATDDTLFVGEFGVFPDTTGDEIFRFAADGTPLVADTINAGPTGHAGLAFDAAGNFYVSNFANDAFASGRVLKYGPLPGLAPQGFFAPNPFPSAILQGAAGLAFDDSGNLYVAGLITNNAGNIVKFTVSGGAVTGEAQLGASVPFPAGILMHDDTLLVASLGATTGDGAIFKYNTVTGERTNMLVGDFNADRIVDLDDLAQWQTAFGVDGSADADGDGDSDGADLLALQRGLGNAGPPGATFSPAAIVYFEPVNASAVPEPTTLALALVLAALAISGRGRPRTFAA